MSPNWHVKLASTILPLAFIITTHHHYMQSCHHIGFVPIYFSQLLKPSLDSITHNIANYSTLFYQVPLQDGAYPQCTMNHYQQPCNVTLILSNNRISLHGLIFIKSPQHQSLLIFTADIPRPRVFYLETCFQPSTVSSHFAIQRCFQFSKMPTKQICLIYVRSDPMQNQT